MDKLIAAGKPLPHQICREDGMNHRILIKIGGRAFEDEQGFQELAEAILSTEKVEVIIVHGGGAEISQA